MQGRFVINRVHLPFLLFLFLSFFYVFYPFTIEESFISADAVYDAQIAKNIIWDRKLGWQATLQPPFQAILTAIVYPLTSNVLTAGILVSKFMLWLLPLSVYLLALRLFGPKTAFFSAVLVSFHPHYAFASNMMEPTVTYTALLMAALFLSWEAFSKESFIYAVIAGMFFSFAYMARSEGFLILVFMSLGLTLIIARKKKREQGLLLKIGVVVVIILTYILISTPYLQFLKGTYGKMVLSPKSSYVQIWMKWKFYRDNNSGEIGNEELWGLNNEGKLKWQEPKGAIDLISYLISKPEKNLRIYLENLSKEIPGRIGTPGGQGNYPQVYPLYFVLPALFWLAVTFRKRCERTKAVFLLSPFLILLVLPVYTPGWWKYLLPYAPLIVIMAVAGLLDISNRVKMKFLLPFFCVSIVLYSVWAVKSSAYALNKSEYKYLKGLSAMEMKKAGEWAQNRFSGNPNYMVQWTRLAYYLNGRWTAMPVASLQKTFSYAKKNSVDYVVYEAYGQRKAIDVIKYLRKNQGLKVFDVYKDPDSGYHVLFFKINEES